VNDPRPASTAGPSTGRQGPSRPRGSNPGEVGRTRVSSLRSPPPRPVHQESLLAKPNYSFEKRQRELAKKKKQEQKLEQKRQQKLAKSPGESAPAPGDASTEAGPDGTT
jgi:hypothetical protein